MAQDSTLAQERTLTAMYDTRGAAEMARSELISIGVPESGMSIRGTEMAGETATAGAGEEKGFWASLADLFVPDDDRSVYAEGMRRGGYLLSARVPAGLEDQAIDCLERSEPVDLDARADEWRQSGWKSDTSVYTGDSAYAGSSSGSYASDTARSDEIADAQELATRHTYADTGESARPAGSLAAGSDRDDPTRIRGQVDVGATEGGSGSTLADNMGLPEANESSSDLGVTPTGRTSAGGFGRTDGAGTIQVVEEQVQVGKREANRGSVRVRSYVVERPVEAQVQLREERVTLERRPVDRPVEAGEAAFEEKTIEAIERGEEAVVGKSARVVEEIDVRKDVDTRTETVHDTVRKTEVEVDDDRTETGRGMSATDTPRRR